MTSPAGDGGGQPGWEGLLAVDLADMLLSDVGDAAGEATGPPQWLVLGINNYCNLHCRMRDVGLGDPQTVFWSQLIGRQPLMMDVALYERILDQAQEFDPPPGVALVYTEPLLHPAIGELVAAATARGLTTSLPANGLLLSRHAAALVAAGLQQLTLSVDGPPVIHNVVRGHPQSFERLAAGVEQLRAAQAARGVEHPAVDVSYTITDANIGHLPEFLEAVRPWRPRTIYISHLLFITAAMAAAHNAVTPPELHVTRSNLGEQQPAEFDLTALWAELQAAQELAATWPAGPALHFTPAFTAPTQLATYYRDELTFLGQGGCRAPYRQLMVATDGRVLPAQGRCYDVTLGNVLEEPLTAIWNGPRARWLRQELRQAGGILPACTRCCGVVSQPVRTSG
ncbi:MAG: SPASM domain-containing protein [Fimbriimonadaceae bacterium]|nr:SPASM domain-containing protein [Fimbriimonadaceae bacterium]